MFMIGGTNLDSGLERLVKDRNLGRELLGRSKLRGKWQQQRLKDGTPSAHTSASSYASKEQARNIL